MDSSALSQLIGFLDDEEASESAAASIKQSSCQSRAPKIPRQFLSKWTDPCESSVFNFRTKNSVVPEVKDILYKNSVIGLNGLLELLKQKTPPALPSVFYLVCVLSRVLPTKFSKASSLPFQEWIVSDLQGSETSVMLFGEAFKAHSGNAWHNQGSVIVIHSPETLGMKMACRQRMQIRFINPCVDFGVCKSCPLAVDLSISRFCPTHAQEQLLICAGNRVNVSNVALECMRSGTRKSESTEEVPKERTTTRTHGLRPISGKDDAIQVVKELRTKTHLTAGERMVVTALKLQNLSEPHARTCNVPELTSSTLLGQIKPIKRAKLGSGLAGVTRKLEK